VSCPSPDADEGRVLEPSADQARIRVCEDHPVPMTTARKARLAVLLGHQRLERRALPRVPARASAAKLQSDAHPLILEVSSATRTAVR